MYDCTIEGCIAMLKLSADDKLFFEKISALIKLGALIKGYASEGYAEVLLKTIAEKKMAYILEAKSKSALKEILAPPKVRYDYAKVQPVGIYHIDEEELICWSATSFIAPLNNEGFERMMELMKRIFPEFEF